MPGVLSHRGSFARPSKPPPLIDPRAYDTALTAGSSTGFNPIVKPQDSPVSRAIMASNPTHYWTFDKLYPTGPGALPSYAPSAGPSWMGCNGAVSSVTGIVPGDRGRAAFMSGGTGRMKAQDYWAKSGSDEILSAEIWVNVGAFPADSAFMGSWASSVGWFIGFGASDGTIYFQIAGTNILTPTTKLAVGKVYHLVAVLGGTQSDYYSRMYLNGVDVGSALCSNSATPGITPAVALEVGTYANNAGGKFVCTYQHMALYSRMLQPSEVRAHYQAAFQRG